ncbi:hypothetical protein ARMSODRAFT_1004186 [Armillaria solidipes]|uniref:Uncharacterized protein n=1 Tax=Armillaria solidipes TaxID=1076256 RepID=A0A2H3BTS7_9AGAR|nr:hypothetical protein ARMSODRAFT_1004186 [Armillaria solidipes]
MMVATSPVIQITTPGRLFQPSSQVTPSSSQAHSGDISRTILPFLPPKSKFILSSMSLSDTDAKVVTHSSTPRSCQAHESCTPPRSTSGPDRGPVIAVIIFSLSISFVAVLLYCLLKPVSDLISGAGHGFGAAITTTCSGIALFFNGTWGSFISRAGPTFSYIQCEYLRACPSTPSHWRFHDEHSKILYNRTVSMAALLNLEAEDAVHIKLYLTNISNGLVFEAVAVQIDVFSRLSLEAGFDHQLPEEVRPELTERFQHERNELRKFRSSMRAVNEVGYDTLKTFKEQMAPLEKPIKQMWYLPSSSSYETVRAQMGKFCDIVDGALSQLHREVDKSLDLLMSINDDLDRLNIYLSKASNSLPGLKSKLRPYFSALGLSGTLDHNIAKLEGFALQVGLAAKDLDALGNVLDKMAHGSIKLRRFLATVSPAMVEDLDLLAMLDKFKEYQRLLV